MKQSKEDGADNSPKKAKYQRCPVMGCVYTTKSRNLGVHMKRKHSDKILLHKSTINSVDI